jgi:hypothetical protein
MVQVLLTVLLMVVDAVLVKGALMQRVTSA